MSSLILSFLDDNNDELTVYSTPPYTDSDGKEREAKITVQPWGPKVTSKNLDRPVKQQPTHVTMYFSIVEAEALAQEILQVVNAAKKGDYSEVGELLVGRSGRKALKDK